MSSAKPLALGASFCRCRSHFGMLVIKFKMKCDETTRILNLSTFVILRSKHSTTRPTTNVPLTRQERENSGKG